MNTWELQKFAYDKNVWKIIDGESVYTPECRIEFQNQDRESFSILIDKDISKQIMELIIGQLSIKADDINSKLKQSFEGY